MCQNISYVPPFLTSDQFVIWMDPRFSHVVAKQNSLALLPAIHIFTPRYSLFNGLLRLRYCTDTLQDLGMYCSLYAVNASLASS